MKTKLLPSLSEVVEYEYITYQDAYLSIVLFNNFSKQEPKLYMFIPCDKEGNVLEKPNLKNYIIKGTEQYDYERFDPDMLKYQQALGRVIFDGFKVDDTHERYHLIVIESKVHYFEIYFNRADGKLACFMELESLADLSGIIELNINGIKQAGL